MNDCKYWLPAPDGARYVLTIASPCEDCETPAGVIVERFDASRADDIDNDCIEQLDLTHAAPFPIVDPRKLFKRFMRLVCGMFGVREYYDVPDELWRKITPFDPDETRRELYDLLGAQIRKGCSKVDTVKSETPEE